MFIVICKTVVLSQYISARFVEDNKNLTIENKIYLTLHIEVSYGEHTTNNYLLPGDSYTIHHQFSKHEIRTLKIKQKYNLKCYYADVERIERIRDAREKRRQEQIIANAVLAFADQLLLKGTIGKIKDFKEFASMAINGANAEQWADKLIGQVLEGEMQQYANNNWQRGAISAGFSLLQLLEAGNYPDLEQQLANSLDALNNNNFKRDDKIKSIVNELPKKNRIARNFMKGFAISYGYNSTIFKNLTYEKNINSGIIEKGYGQIINSRLVAYPLIFDISGIENKYNILGLNNIYGNECWLKYLGSEFSISLVLPTPGYEFAKKFVPYVGVGYQPSQISLLSSDKYFPSDDQIISNISTTGSIVKAGLMLNFGKKWNIFSEYKRTIKTNSNRGYSQFNISLGFRFH
jgi:hypothetical protein